jgi:hypothetical protein
MHKVCTICVKGLHQVCTCRLGPAHGPRADVEELAASAWLQVLVAFSPRKEVPLAASQRRRNGAVVPRWDERQPPQDGGDWHDVDDGLLWLIQLLRPALASLPPPGGDSPVHRRDRDEFNMHTLCTLTQRPDPTQLQ